MKADEIGFANAVASWPTVLLAAPATPMVTMITAVTTPSRDIAALAEDINPHRLGETGHEVQET